MKPIQIPLFFLLGACLVSGCGQKGSLYLPEAEPGAERNTQPEKGTEKAESGNEEENEDS
jgi:predicted small lipoprotein YifL